MDGINGLDALTGALKNLQKQSKQNASRALARIGLIAQREAVANAPRSPTMKNLSATLKRKKRTAHRTYPGGLEKSITTESNSTQVSIFVAANSYAGRYAKRIHDEKGKSWRNRVSGERC